mgnify:CR=1 FL=1
MGLALACDVRVASERRLLPPVGISSEDGRLRIADGLWVVGDPAGPELHTHQGHYQGQLAVRMALGESVTLTWSSIKVNRLVMVTVANGVKIASEEVGFVGTQAMTPAAATTACISSARTRKSRRTAARRSRPGEASG